MDAPRIEGFELRTFTHGGTTRPVYYGGAGPGVVVLHEVPGIVPEVERFARRVIDEGFRVAMPSLFGTPGKPYSLGYNLEQIAHACMSREFHLLAAGHSSPITVWARALCRDLHAECGGPGVGAIGMCLTGNFALALMVDECVLAPVLSQPSLPVGKTRAQKRGLHLSDADLRVVKRRACEEGVSVLGMRFTHDIMCAGERFDRLREELGDGFEGIEIDSGPRNPHGIPRIAHSVVTRDLVDEDGHPTQAALQRVLELFRERLLPPAARA